MSFIAQQPNGLYCRFSSILDCPTHINMTFNKFVDIILEKNPKYSWMGAQMEAQDIIDNHLKPFSEVIDRFMPNNMTQKDFDEIVFEMGIEVDEDER